MKFLSSIILTLLIFNACNVENPLPEIKNIELENFVITELDKKEFNNLLDLNTNFSVPKNKIPIRTFSVQSTAMDISGLIIEFSNKKTLSIFQNNDRALGDLAFSFWTTENDNGQLSLHLDENSEEQATFHLNDNGGLSFNRVSNNKNCFIDNLSGCAEHIEAEVGFLGGLACGLFSHCVVAVAGACGVTSGLSCLGVCDDPDTDGCCWAWNC